MATQWLTLNRPTNGPGLDRVAIVVEPHEAGLRHRGGHGVEAVERPDIGDEALALRLEDLPDGLVGQLGVALRLRQGDAAVLEPGVELGIALEPRPRHEEPPADHPDLVLDLAFLPARGGRAGDRIDQVMSAHLLEPAIVGAILADEDRVHSRLHVVIDTPGTGPAEECEGPVVRVKHHLLGLARIGTHERHPAVAQADMGNLHGRGHPIEDHDLMAPVELVGLTRIEAQRHVGTGRCLLSRPRPTGRISAHGIIAAVIAPVAQLLVNPDQRQPFALRPPGILRQQPVQV